MHTEDQGASLNGYSAVTLGNAKQHANLAGVASGTFHIGESAERGEYSRGGPDLMWFRSFAALRFPRAPG